MKKTIVLVAILIFIVAMCCTSFAQAQSENPPTRTLTNLITFFQKPVTSKPRPRSAGFVPVTGTYSAQGIRLHFLEDIGEMTITVINHSTGEQSFEYVDSAFESTAVYISGDEGQYSIVIDAQDGSSYYAEFEL